MADVQTLSAPLQSDTPATPAAEPSTPSQPTQPTQQPSQATQPTQQQQADWVGARDFAKQFGVDLSHYGDDAQALQALIDAYREMPRYQHLARYGIDYLQQQQPQQPQEQPKSWWSPPASREEIQQLMARWYETDPRTGEPRPRPDCPASVIQKVTEGAEYYQNWQQKLTYDPQGALKSIFEHELPKYLNDHLGKEKQKEMAVNILERHSNWMFYRDPTGRPTGWTPDGLKFATYVNQLTQMGVTDPVAQERLALAELRREQLENWYRAQNQPKPQQPATPANYQEPATQGVPAGDDIEVLLRHNLAKAGIDSRLQLN